MSKSRATSKSTSLYRAVWRWHFYAGLLILPFLLLLAVTGGLYLFHDEINAYLYQDLRTVEASDQPMLPASALVQRANAAMPGHVARITLPDAPTAAVRVVTTAGAGSGARFFDGEHEFTGYLNPDTGAVLGVMPLGGIMETVRNIHSLSYFGFWANCLIEIVAGWCLIMVASGIFLWWPRGRKAGVMTVRRAPRRRVFWRDLHALTGVCAAAVIGFLALTGMPWTPVWGQQLHRLVVAADGGAPPVPQSSVPVTTHAQHLGNTGWTLDPMPVPRSGAAQTQPIGLDRAVAIFARLGMHAGYRIALPDGPRGVYSASWRADSGTGMRVIHLDQYSGEVLADLGFEDLGAGSQWISWAIAVHRGDQYGWINQLVMLAGCIAIVMLVITSAIMWWKRRPRGTLGVPPAPQERRAVHVVAAIIALGGVLFPLVGVSMLVALGFDCCVQLVRKQRRRRLPA